MDERDQHLRLMQYIYSSPQVPSCEEFAEVMGIFKTTS